MNDKEIVRQQAQTLQTVLNVVINMHVLWRIMETRQSLKSCCHHDFIEKQSNATLRKSILCMEKVNRSKIAYTTYIQCAKLRKFSHWRVWIGHNYHCDIIMLHSMVVITWQTLNWNHYSITCWEIIIIVWVAINTTACKL